METNKYFTEKMAYKENINHIFETYDQFEDELVKKSLLLSAFSIAESFLTNYLKEEMGMNNKEDKVLDFKQRHGVIRIEELLTNYKERRSLYKSLYSSKLHFPKDKEQGLRNSLAHDITTAKINGNIISFPFNNKDKDIEELDLKIIISYLENYSDTLGKNT